MTDTNKTIKVNRKIDIANETVITWKEYNALQMIALTAQRIVSDDFTIDNITLQTLRIKGLKEYVDKLDKLENKIFKL